MTDFLFLDFESRSEIDLEERGLDNYVHSPSTSVLLLAYALNKDEPAIWEPHKQAFPAILEELLDDPFTKKVAWNAGFERSIFKYVLDRDIPINEFVDPMTLARQLSIPGNLEQASEVLQLEDSGKIEDGQRLIDMFCKPVCEAREETLFGSEPAVFRDWNTDPEDWERFKLYCLGDVIAERAALRKLIKFPLTEMDKKGWELDQVINERGIYRDEQLVSNALHIAEQTKYELGLRMKKVTKLDNPNSRDQLLAWAKQRGYPHNSLGKVWVEDALAGKKINEECREVFLLRQQSSKTAWAKYETIQQLVSSDGRLRNQFSFLGASRTGRWSAAPGGVQLHNLPRGTKEVEKKYDLAVNLIRSGKYDRIKQEFSNDMDVVTSCIRAAFCAAPGHKLLISDLSAIENRVIGYIARCQAILDVFLKGLDPYIDFATKMYKIPYEQVTKEQRQISKPAVLACGFRLSGGDDITDRFGNAAKSGLYGYAANYGVDMSKEDAAYAVDLFRKTYKEVVTCWYDLENACFAVVRDGVKTKTVGPLTFEMFDGVLLMHLPSGRRLHYIGAKIEDREFFGKMKPTLIYQGKNAVTKQWDEIATNGGHIIENGTQAMARDLLLHGLMLAEEAGYPIVLHCHDELVVEVPENTHLTLEGLEQCMSVTPSWCAGLPLSAEGFESLYYRKN